MPRRPFYSRVFDYDMGNTSSTVTAGIKDQVNSQSNAMNKLADVTGNGELADAAREAVRTGNTQKLDALIEEKVKPMLYNDGAGDLLLINEIIAQRHRERTGSTYSPAHSTERKFVCWKLDSRGAVGETLLHTCFLSGLPKHMKLLAEQLLVRFPKVINDFYINDEYYGETALHMAIVSENPEIVRFLLKNGADVNSRCSGNFFTCDDQKGRSRTDQSDVEHASISKHTNYPGHLYWGEYPLSFAACLSQMECFRMLVARGADLNAVDTNGNTVLHICVIHENWEMFKMALSLGANLRVLNRQNLTPFTLAAFLARREMFKKIIEEEQTVNWTFGDVQESVYPLEYLDSIEPTTGKINSDSALAIVVYGEKSAHLELLPILLEQLVQRKWTTYGRNTLFSQLFMYICYFFCVLVCFLIRPTPFERDQGKRQLLCTAKWDWHALRGKDLVYHVLSIMSVLGATLYLVQTWLHIHNVGRKMYFLGMSGFPAKTVFLISCCLMLIGFVLRLLCLDEAEDIVWVMTVLLTAVKFLFFCRGFKSVGPFVLMLYKIILRDLMRFFLIYLVIVIGFSQGRPYPTIERFLAFYIIFLGYKRNDPNYLSERREKSIMSNVAESYVRMFIMSLTEFSVFFEQLEDCEHTVIGKITFVIYMLLVTILLINMLIAMMTNTYIEVSGNSLEWLRQWSAIIMIMEQSYDPSTRLQYQAEYSILMEDGKSKALLLKTRLKEEEVSMRKEFLHAAKRRFKDELRRRPIGAQIAASLSGANYFSK